jgi:DNA repair protein RecN (Recombination protein N)
MLRSLTIRDFVIVHALDLDLADGFTVFTGETGAGKSILIDALALTLGERADAAVVREGAPRADITAAFDAHPQVAAWLEAHELHDDEGVILLRRTVDAAGRSKAFINGAAVTLAQLREVGEQLVDIHGQHAHQLLLKTDAQRSLLDAHAGLEDARRPSSNRARPSSSASASNGRSMNCRSSPRSPASGKTYRPSTIACRTPPA